MKRNAFFLLILLVVGCSSQQSNSSNEGDSSQTAIDTMALGHADSDRFLTIHGKDIWVRDSSSTGPVIMKLNEGDRCAFYGLGHLEIIRGEADYWYNVEYQGKEGWVFGSQTDWKGRNIFLPKSLGDDYWNPSGPPTPQPALSGKTAESAWKRFKDEKVKICESDATTDAAGARLEGHLGHTCNITELEAGNFKLVEGVEFKLYQGSNHIEHEFYEERYTLDNDTVETLWFSSVVWSNGRGTKREKTILGTCGQDWTIHGIIEGAMIDHIALGNDTILFAFHWGEPSAIMEEEGISVWRSIQSLHSFQRIQTMPFPGCIVDRDQGCIYSFESAQFGKGEGQRIQLALYYQEKGEATLTWNPAKQIFQGDYR